MHQKYGVAAFITIPLETGAGVAGTVTAAGGPKMDRHAVQGLAARLAEALLRRSTEALLKVQQPCELNRIFCLPVSATRSKDLKGLTPVLHARHVGSTLRRDLKRMSNACRAAYTLPRSDRL